MDDKVRFGGLVVVAYTIYMVCTWPNSPDGVILSGVIGVLAALAGVHYGQTKATMYQKANEDQEEPSTDPM